MCMRVELNQAKNGFLSRFARSMKSSVAPRNSSSTVSMRFLVSGPVSVQLCLPHLPKRGSSPGVSTMVAVQSQDAARTETQPELRILRIIGVLRFVLGIQMVEIAEELVEAVNRRQKVIAIAKMVLTELSGNVALRLEQFGKCRVLVRQPFLCSRQADFEKPVRIGLLAGDERRAAGGAGLLAVIVGEDRAFVGDAVDVGCSIAHLPRL